MTASEDQYFVYAQPARLVRCHQRTPDFRLGYSSAAIRSRSMRMAHAGLADQPRDFLGGLDLVGCEPDRGVAVAGNRFVPSIWTIDLAEALHCETSAQTEARHVAHRQSEGFEMSE